MSASYFGIDLTHHRVHLLIIQWVLVVRGYCLEGLVEAAYCLEDLVEEAFLLLEAQEGEA